MPSRSRTTTGRGSAVLTPGTYPAGLRTCTHPGATARVATDSTGKRMLVPNGALRFEPPVEEGPGGVALGGEDFGLEREEARATIGRGSRQTVYILKDDGELEPIEVVTGQSDGRHTVVQSDKLKTGMKVVTSVKAAGQ